MTKTASRFAAGLAYERHGSGEPLVLVHGLGSDRRTWDLVAPALAERFDVIAVDLPGHGDSPALPRTEPATPHRLARRVAALVAELGLTSSAGEPPHVAGNSLGGWVALELGADGHASSLTLLAPAGLWLHPSTRRNPAMRFNRALAASTRPLHPILLKSQLVRSIGLAAGSARPGEVPYDVALAAARAQSDSTGYLAALDGTIGNRFDRADDITTDLPVTVVFGDRDRILPAPGCQRRSLAPTHSRWLVASHCGHAPQWDAPGLVVREIERTVAESAIST